MVASYDELITEVKEHTKRPDKVTRIPAFIKLAEAVINRALRGLVNLEFWDVYLDTDDRRCVLPPGYLNMRTMRIVHNNSSFDLVSCAPEALQLKSSAGMPRFYSVGPYIEFDRIPDRNYFVEMKYYKRLDTLSTTNTTNPILERYPDLYLYLTCSKLHLDARDEMTADYYKTLAFDILNEIKIAENRSSHGAAPAMITEGPTP